jgi:imidazolonepropionase-like amidohydrolase
MFAVNPFYSYAKLTTPTGPLRPRVLIANNILDGPDTVFRWPLGRNVVVARDATSARAGVREIKARGNDFLKVYSSLPREAYFAALQEAEALGMPVAGHIPPSVTVAEASDARQLTIEHLDGVAVECSKLEQRHRAQLRGKDGLGQGFDAATGWRVYVDAHENYDPTKADALFKKFVANGTWHVPTLIQTRQMARIAEAAALPADVEKQLPDFLTRVWERKITPDGVAIPNAAIRLTRKDLADREALSRGDIALVGKMHAAGVRILAGTDATAPLVVPGISLHEELVLLVEAGLTRAEALRAATLDPARCLKMEDRLGAIREGLLADLVLLTGNPLDDIRHTRSIEAVIVGGQVVPR